MVRMDEIPAVAGEKGSTRPQIPNKLFFRIGEVSQIIGVEPYVLRFWESEFKGLAPKKSSSGQRMFRKKDVELLLQIRELLYERKFTIEGARQALSDSVSKSTIVPAAKNPLPAIRKELTEILKLVS